MNAGITEEGAIGLVLTGAAIGSIITGWIAGLALTLAKYEACENCRQRSVASRHGINASPARSTGSTSPQSPQP